jgi:hypothetical protein
MLQYEVAYPEHLSRLMIFIKWLLVIPHLVVLALLGIGVYIVTLIAWFAILITGKYPRGMWNFTMMTMRWGARVTAYMYLQRDEYPPFGDADYPVYYQMEYPERLSRGLIFIKWLLIIPHFIVLYILNLLLEVVIVISWFAILFTGKYPRGMFDFTTGVTRWAHRVSVYVLLLTDAYPPFSMDNAAPASGAIAGGAMARNF